MRVLFLTNNLKGLDGRSKVSLDYALELQNLGYDVFCLTRETSNQEKIEECPLLGAPLKYLANPLTSFLTALKIKRKIREFSPDIIHFMVEPYTTLLPFLKIEKAKTFLTVHGTYSVIPALFNKGVKKIISNYLSKKYYKKIDRIVAVSFFTKNHLLKYYPWLKQKIEVITNGINLEKNKIIDLSKKPKNKIKKILFVGIIKKRKGILEAIEACRYYRDNFSANFIYEIVGSYNKNDGYYKILCKKIKEYNLEDKIVFRGRVTDEELEKLYFDADLFMMLSLNLNNNFEGFGLVFLEANAKGVPCIGPKNSGSEEAIIDGKTGYIVDPSNFKEIAQKIDLVLNKDRISPQECIEWAKKNNIRLKTRELINFYQGL